MGETQTATAPGITEEAFYGELYKAPVMVRIDMIKKGVRATDARQWLEIEPLGRSATLKALDLPVATFNRKVKEDGRLSPAESERVIGFARLVGQVEAMTEEAPGFDARAWLAGWLVQPLPALGHARPIDLMDTMEGQALVARTLDQAVSGAYA